ncbi:hypothetical protein B0J18DRAFT_282581 [Chaetomium sp. MPI-SDFR-AT-0129]|nr:hypothetical protein B0J18DRAFT_282581 [Chaetomium sp. MPI-SDFR-AT-0129]
MPLQFHFSTFVSWVIPTTPGLHVVVGGVVLLVLLARWCAAAVRSWAARVMPSTGGTQPGTPSVDTVLVARQNVRRAVGGLILGALGQARGNWVIGPDALPGAEVRILDWVRRDSPGRDSDPNAQLPSAGSLPRAVLYCQDPILV